MKYIIKITSLILLFTYSTSGYSNNKDSTAIKRDVQHYLTARAIDGNLFINLSMINESKPGKYSLIKIDSNGSSESICQKDININTSNKRQFYSFIVKDKSEVIVTYQLVRISNNRETIGTWEYSPSENTITNTH